MKATYKIVWLDDQPELMRNTMRDIATILTDNFFIPDIQEPYKSYEEFQSTFQALNPNDIYGEVFNDCDLLLIDNNIAEKKQNEEKTGAILIKQLREKGIYTETVFYSNAMLQFRQKHNLPELDNVVYADKSELVHKVEKLVKKTVVQSMVISNLRGYLMDCTSDFDFICRAISEHYFALLNDDQQNEILMHIENFIHEQFINENKKFIDINRKYKNIIDYKKQVEANAFNSLKDATDRIKKLKKALDSQESVMLVRNKFLTLAMILRMNGIERAKDIYIFDTDSNKYNDDIVSKRNQLAHNKLMYGQNHKNHIKIVKSLTDYDCDCIEEYCNSFYTIDQCHELRKKIYSYYILFNSLLDPLKKSDNK